MTSGFEATAWAWVDHLRHGGSIPWLDWVARSDPDDGGSGGAAQAVGATLPGAGELEYVRRLAARSRLTPDAFRALADLVLARSGPGRGLAQLPLVWPAVPAVRRVGAPPTDPARVPADELVRIGVGTLADQLLRTDPGPARRRRPRRHPWTTQFRLAGAPVTGDAVRAWLRGGGLVEGGRSPDVLVFAEPLDVLLAQVWSARVQRGAPVRWDTFVGRWARRGELPPAARLPETAARWAARVGPERVHLVVAPSGPDAARRTASAVLDARGHDGARSLQDLSPTAVDLLRRLNRVTNVRVPLDRRRPLLRRAAALVAHHDSAPLAVPEPHRGWAEQTAAGIAERLRAGRYSVHGDLEEIALRHRAGPSRPRHRDVLDLVLDACLTLAEPVPSRREAR